nr:hypothetical protein [Tanacetum cinerariifolium]
MPLLELLKKMNMNGQSLRMYYLTPSRDKIERLEKANERYKSAFSTFSENERQYLIQIKELQDENKLLKSKGVDCTKCQSFQVQVEELKSVNDRLTKTNQKLLNSRECGKANLQQRDEKISALRKKLRLLEEQSELASQNYTSLQKENNDLRTSYNELKETYETDCEKLEKENSDLKMHYKRLFDSINQKNVVYQVFTNSSPKVNVSEKIFTGKSSKPISKKISIYYLFFAKR